MSEIWKEIKGYEGLYQVSNLGRVRSLRYNKILKPCVSKTGYEYVLLVDRNSHNKNHRLHRLVAMTFLPNPENLPQVNHKDENKLNNCADNLEWCTAGYNTSYGTGIRRRVVSVSKPCVCLETGVVYSSASEASRQTGIMCVVDCCRGKHHTAGGYHWEYITRGGDAKCPSM